MPLVSPPNRGYLEWQRVGNYDSDSVWVEDGGVTSGGIFSPVIDCSRYAYIAGFLSCQLAAMGVQFQWFLDNAATITVGTRNLQIDHDIISVAQVRIVNLGPFLRVFLGPLAAGNYHPAASLFLSNRTYPLELVPSVPVLVDSPGRVVNAGTQFAVYPTDYYAGPVNVWHGSLTPGMNVHYQFITATGVWDDFDEHPIPAANITYTTVTPLGAWRVLLDNATGGNITVNIVVTPSITGAT